MATVDVWNTSFEKVGTLELSDEVFDEKSREDLVWEVVKSQRACMRSGTASTKTRADVSGTGAKPYRQKRTGRARQGTLRAPHQRGGGVAFGPKLRSYAYHVPKKVRRKAMRSVLSGQTRQKKMWVVRDFDLPEIKTKKLAEILTKFGISKALLVDKKDNRTLKLSSRNLPGFHYRSLDGLNLVELVSYENLIISETSIKQLQEVLKP